MQRFHFFGTLAFPYKNEKLLKLACMECRTESAETVAMFFRLWNKALMMAGGKTTPYFFNQKNIMVDSAGSKLPRH